MYNIYKQYLLSNIHKVSGRMKQLDRIIGATVCENKLFLCECEYVFALTVRQYFLESWKIEWAGVWEVLILTHEGPGGKANSNQQFSELNLEYCSRLMRQNMCCVAACWLWVRDEVEYALNAIGERSYSTG